MDSQSWYMRSTELVAVTSGDRVLLVGEGGSVFSHPTRQAAEWSGLMQLLANPVTGSDVRSSYPSIPELADGLWEDLVAAGLVIASAGAESLIAKRDSMFSDNQGFHLVPQEPVCRHLIAACTGSIVAGLMAPTLLSLCYSRFQRALDVILTEAAQKFITRDLLESYGIRTWVDAFERREDVYVPHVQLGRSADCILVMPATAASLHRLVDGACTDLLSMTVVASLAPVVVAPVMNEAMWNHKTVQRNLQALRDDGTYVIEPTLIFGAADLAGQGRPMFGGHGTLWAGPRSLMHVLSAIMTSASEAAGSAPPTR